MTRRAITIVGAGNVGMALARAFIAKGESVVFGVPHPDKYRETVSALGPAARVAATADAEAGSELVILATPYPAALSVAQSVADWQNRILVDAIPTRSPRDSPACRSARPPRARKRLRKSRTARAS